MKPRCAWARNPLAIAYHDREWGVPVRDDRRLFEFLVLEGAQAGLSWDTILAKRENYRRAFDGFDPEKIARYGAKKKKSLMNDAGIVRNRHRTMATVPARTAVSDALSKELRKRGFKFVGSTIMYAFMQAVGMVDDHVAGCFRCKLRSK